MAQEQSSIFATQRLRHILFMLMFVDCWSSWLLHS